MENESKKNWAFFAFIIIGLWILYSIIGFFVWGTNDLEKLSTRLIYYGLFMVLITYYSARRYKETVSHRSYLFVDIILMTLIFIIWIGLRIYTSIVGVY